MRSEWGGNRSLSIPVPTLLDAVNLRVYSYCFEGTL
jgi:hypothetical protein